MISAGKTNTVQEIAKTAGKMCFLFNCSSSFKYESIIKFFRGFVQGGSWTCFDEFNRIETSVISALS
jgi:dynein heavy chain